MLIDSVHRKDQNYYPKASFKKCFIADIEIFCSNSDEKHYDEEYVNLFLKSFKKKEKDIIFLSLGFQICYLKNEKFFIFERRKFYFLKYKTFFLNVFFFISSSEI